MKYVTVAMATEAANQLTHKAFEGKVEKLQKELQKLVDDLVIKYVDDPVLQCGKEFSNFYETSRSVCFFREGGGSFGTKHLFSSFSHPIFRCIAISDKDWKLLCNAEWRAEEMRRKKESFLIDVKRALVQLRSRRMIEKHFPEALPYLNFSESTALVPDYSVLRKYLSNVK